MPANAVLKWTGNVSTLKEDIQTILGHNHWRRKTNTKGEADEESVDPRLFPSLRCGCRFRPDAEHASSHPGGPRRDPGPAGRQLLRHAAERRARSCQASGNSYREGALH